MQIIVGIIGLALIIFVHELGHYIMAKIYKVRVIEFAIGMGPKLFSFTKGDTLYSVRILPLGGFCRLHTLELHLEDPNTTLPKAEGTLFSLPFFKKAFILLGGPLANILCYLFISFILFMAQYSKEDLGPFIEPIKNAPIEQAGLLIGNEILSINGEKTDSFSEIARLAKKYRGTTITVLYRNNNTIKSTPVSLNKTSPFLGAYPFVEPRITKTHNKENPLFLEGDIITKVNKKDIKNAIYFGTLLNENKGSPTTIEVLRNNKKIVLQVIINDKTPLSSLGLSFPTVIVTQWKDTTDFFVSQLSQIWLTFTSSIAILQKLFTFQTKKIQNQIAGPLRIISIVGENTILIKRTRGIVTAIEHFLFLIAMLSLAIAIMNLIPIPILDGGQLVFYAFFAAIKKEPKIKYLLFFQKLGVLLMLLLFILVMFGDISYIIGSFM